LISRDGAWFYTDSRYIEAAGAAIKDAQVILVDKDSKYPQLLAALLKESGITSLGFEDAAMSYAAYLDWNSKLEVELVPAQNLLNDLRAVKTEADLAKMKKAQRISENSFTALLPRTSTDMTEKELAAELVYLFGKNGADDKSFDPIVVSGSRSSLPHGVPGNGKLSEGFLTIDFGVKLDGWCSDTTRTLCIGPPSAEMENVYNIVLAAQEAGIAAVRGGVGGREVDAAARAVIEEAGYGDSFGHGFGHGLGLEVHELPTAARTYEGILPVGAVISAEPGIYLPGRFGVRIEDVVYVTEDGCENITELPKALTVI
jgi:Xaa-Pro aminopeptidase